MSLLFVVLNLIDGCQLDGGEVYSLGLHINSSFCFCR